MTMTRLALLACLAALPFVGLAACGTETPPDPCLDAVRPAAEGAYVNAATPREDKLLIVYADGRTFEIPREPERIVCGTPGLTETVAWLGGEGLLAGVSPHCDTPDSVDVLPRVRLLPPDLETLAGIAPDLILLDEGLQASAIEELAQHHEAVLPLQMHSLAHLDTTFDLLSQIVGTRESRERALRFHRQLAALLPTVGGDEGAAPLRVLLLAESDPLFAVGPDALLDDMLCACGALNIACDLGRASGPFAEELVLSRGPDLIITLGGPLPEATIVRWGRVPAVSGERVVSGRADDLLRAGPRTIEALQRLSDVLHGRALPGSLADDR